LPVADVNPGKMNSNVAAPRSRRSRSSPTMRVAGSCPSDPLRAMTSLQRRSAILSAFGARSAAKSDRSR